MAKKYSIDEILNSFKSDIYPQIWSFGQDGMSQTFWRKTRIECKSDLRLVFLETDTPDFGDIVLSRAVLVVKTTKSEHPDAEGSVTDIQGQVYFNGRDGNDTPLLCDQVIPEELDRMLNTGMLNFSDATATCWAHTDSSPEMDNLDTLDQLAILDFLGEVVG